MAKPDSLLDRMFYANRREYTVKRGNVSYLDAKGLRRPFSMPAGFRLVTGIFIIAALVVGYVIIDRTILSTIRESESMQAAVEQNLQREPSINTVPNMFEVATLDEDSVRVKFRDSGYTLYDASDTTESYDMLLYKLPSDMTVDSAEAMFARGISALNPEQATKLLVGLWMFGIDYENSTRVVRYADFSTGDPQTAVQNALKTQGIDSATIGESGVDDSGNTYASGTTDLDGTVCGWKVSALPLEDMYSISGLPEDACYVGIRITVQ